MANRYWVGGTANWDGTAGTKWALTSGGTGGEAVPTSADDVFFDGSSGANTVTLSGARVAKTLNCTGFTGTLNFSFASAGSLTVSGSVTLDTGMTYTGTQTLTINATGTLTTAGKTISGNLTISAGTVTLGDALTLSSTSTFTVSGGTFTTSASNYAVSTPTLTTSGTGAKTITLNGSTVTLSGATALNLGGSNLTFNAGTSQINCTSDVASTFSGAGLTFYNVAFFQSATSGGVYTISGTNTFNDVVFNAPSAAAVRTINLSNSQTINGTLTCSGASGIRRMFIASNTPGTVQTLTVATCAPSDCDFRDITIAGAAAPISGTRLGDCGNNSGITFDSPKTVYWNPAANATFGSASWATSSGGTTLSTDNFPLAQDTAVIDNSSRATINGSATAWNVGTLDMSNRTNAATVTLNAGGLSIYKDWKFGSGITMGTGGIVGFRGRSAQTITSNGRSFNQTIGIDAPGTTVELVDALTAGSGNTLSLTRGTFDAKTYNVTAGNIFLSGTGTRTLTMGSGLWTVTGTGNLWNAGTVSNLTLNKNTADITCTNTTSTARTFVGGGRTYNKLTIAGSNNANFNFTGSNTFSELASTKTTAFTITFAAGTTTSVGAWTISGSSGQLVTVTSATAATHTITKTGGGIVSANYLSISYSTATPSNTWYAGANSTDGGNNSGWIFTAPPNTANFMLLF